MFTLDNEPESQICSNDVVLQLISRLVEAINAITTDRGLSTFKVVCDENNNTPETIDEGQLIVDVFVQPTAPVMVDFIFPSRSQTEGKGSLIETLPEPHELGSVSDLEYFIKKPTQIFRIPANYLKMGK